MIFCFNLSELVSHYTDSIFSAGVICIVLSSEVQFTSVIVYVVMADLPST